MMNGACKLETINDLDKIEQVLLLFNHAFPRPLSERIGNLRDYAKKLAKNAVVNIISLEDKIAGFSAYYCNDMLTKQAFLTQIAVADSCKGMRIGNILLDFCIETSREKGMEKLICEVDNDNDVALRFYKKNGFVYLKKAGDWSQFLLKHI